jgi:hypothetical protein
MTVANEMEHLKTVICIVLDSNFSKYAAQGLVGVPAALSFTIRSMVEIPEKNLSNSVRVSLSAIKCHGIHSRGERYG